MTGDDMRELRSLLLRATDRVSSAHLSQRALTAARRRRRQRGGLVVAGAVAAVALIVAIALPLSERHGSAPPATSSASSPAPRSPSPSASATPSSPPAERIDTEIVQPKWDPRDVDELPVVEGLVPALPAVVTPPESAPALADSPLDSAVLSVDRGASIQLMSPDGEWRSVPVPDRRALAGRLSPSGTGLVLLTDETVEIWNLPSGQRESLPLPTGFKPWDFTSAEWVNDQTLLLDDFAGGWVMDLGTGLSTRVPFPREVPYWWTIDADGALVESADYSKPAVLTDWRGGESRQRSMASTGRLMRPEVSEESIVGVTNDTPGLRDFAVVVAERSGLSPIAALPVHDHDGNYSNWALGILAVRDDGTVLLWSALPGRGRVEGWRIVAWEPESGDLRVVTRSDASATWTMSFARGLLA